MSKQEIPVLTIDGPSGSGKGTIAQLLADELGWHTLDSGALYRLTGHAVATAGIAFDDVEKIGEIAANLEVEFKGDVVLLAGVDVSLAIRTSEAGNNASKVAALQPVRDALLAWQKDYARSPGLIADGRDMGTTVFPLAGVKVFLTASAAARAQRRYKQLIEKGLDANLPRLTAEINERDERDRTRSSSPLLPAEDAMELDSTELSIAEVVEKVLTQVRVKWPHLVD